MSPSDTPTLADVRLAAERISPFALRTPLIPSQALTERVRATVRMKLETLQATGSFKIRGAANRLIGCTQAERRAGMVTASTGNHGRAVAHMARLLDLPCTVCMSDLVPENKRDAIRSLGAAIEIGGLGQDGAFEVAQTLVSHHGLVFIEPFDDAMVIAGQATLALEIVDAFPEIERAIVPLSGGGLAAGVCMALKASKPSIRTTCVSTEACPAMARSLEAGRPILVEERASLADSLGGGIGLANRLTFAMVRDFVDEIILVTEAEIANAMRFLFRTEQLIVEGAGAVAAAVLLRENRAHPVPTAILLTGRNVSTDLWLNVCQDRLR